MDKIYQVLSESSYGEVFTIFTTVILGVFTIYRVYTKLNAFIHRAVNKSTNTSKEEEDKPTNTTEEEKEESTNTEQKGNKRIKKMIEKFFKMMENASREEMFTYMMTSAFTLYTMYKVCTRISAFFYPPVKKPTNTNSSTNNTDQEANQSTNIINEETENKGDKSTNTDTIDSGDDEASAAISLITNLFEAPGSLSDSHNNEPEITPVEPEITPERNKTK